MICIEGCVMIVTKLLFGRVGWSICLASLDSAWGGRCPRGSESRVDCERGSCGTPISSRITGLGGQHCPIEYVSESEYRPTIVFPSFIYGDDKGKIDKMESQKH